MDKIPQLDKPDLYVVARILERLWREESPMLKTRLQVSSNLNYDVFRKYLAWMVDHGLTSFEDSADGHEKVRLSPKGEEAYRKLVQWINEVVRERGPGI
jgi:predicted transcriptional regulator